MLYSTTSGTPLYLWRKDELSEALEECPEDMKIKSTDSFSEEAGDFYAYEAVDSCEWREAVHELASGLLSSGWLPEEKEGFKKMYELTDEEADAVQEYLESTLASIKVYILRGKASGYDKYDLTGFIAHDFGIYGEPASVLLDRYFS